MTPSTSQGSLTPVPGTTARAVLPAPFRAPPGVLVAATVLLLEPPERHHVTLDGQTHGYVTQLAAWLDADGTPRLAHLARERFELAAELAPEGLDPAPGAARREPHAEAIQPIGAGDSALEGAGQIRGSSHYTRLQHVKFSRARPKHPWQKG